MCVCLKYLMFFKYFGFACVFMYLQVFVHVCMYVCIHVCMYVLCEYVLHVVCLCVFLFAFGSVSTLIFFHPIHSSRKRV
jgi:hypothetical protein